MEGSVELAKPTGWGFQFSFGPHPFTKMIKGSGLRSSKRKPRAQLSTLSSQTPSFQEPSALPQLESFLTLTTLRTFQTPPLRTVLCIVLCVGMYLDGVKPFVAGSVDIHTHVAHKHTKHTTQHCPPPPPHTHTLSNTSVHCWETLRLDKSNMYTDISVPVSLHLTISGICSSLPHPQTLL